MKYLFAHLLLVAALISVGCDSSGTTNIRDSVDDEAIAEYEAAIAEMEARDNQAESGG